MENQRRLSQKNRAVLGLLKEGKLPLRDIQNIPQKKRALWALGQNIENPTPEDEFMINKKQPISPSKLGFGRSRKQKKNKQKKTKRHSKKW